MEVTVAVQRFRVVVDRLLLDEDELDRVALERELERLDVDLTLVFEEERVTVLLEEPLFGFTVDRLLLTTGFRVLLRLEDRLLIVAREPDVLLRGFTAVDGAVERELVEVRGFTVVDRVLLELLGCTVGVRVVDRVLLMMGRLLSFRMVVDRGVVLRVSTGLLRMILPPEMPLLVEDRLSTRGRTVRSWMVRLERPLVVAASRLRISGVRMMADSLLVPLPRVTVTRSARLFSRVSVCFRTVVCCCRMTSRLTGLATACRTASRGDRVNWSRLGAMGRSTRVTPRPSGTSLRAHRLFR